MTPAQPGEIQLPIYLDNNASTPVDPAVLAKMIAVLKEDFGNPSSEYHVLGRRAAEIIENARSQAARLIHCTPSEIIFTSGATESCNLAIRGAAAAYKDRGNHIITCLTEHKAVLEPCKQLANEGFEITFLRPDPDGRIDPEKIEQAITERTILAAIMLANNVIGTINPVETIATICKKRGIIFFCDATQAVGKIPVDVEKLNCDLASLSAHKMYGPKGAGALYIRQKGPRVRINPLILGGGQERGLRGGTENVAGVAGMGAACEMAELFMENEHIILMNLRDRFENGIMNKIPNIEILARRAPRLPNTTNISFAGVQASRLLKAMPEIAASTGAACDSGGGDSNYVLKAIGVEEDVAAGAVRFSVGRFNTAAQIDYAVDIIAQKINELRK
jgi:cysteine desulfurase